jgi:hypothetical protein
MYICLTVALLAAPLFHATLLVHIAGFFTLFMIRTRSPLRNLCDAPAALSVLLLLLVSLDLVLVAAASRSCTTTRTCRDSNCVIKLSISLLLMDGWNLSLVFSRNHVINPLQNDCTVNPESSTALIECSQRY